MVNSYLIDNIEVFIMDIATTQLNKNGYCVVGIVKTGQTGIVLKSKLIKNGVVKW